MNKPAKCGFPGISDDQAEGCHILSLSHLGKWIPLPAVISVSYKKCLIHNVTQFKNAKLFTRFSARLCRGNSKPASRPLTSSCSSTVRKDEWKRWAPGFCSFTCMLWVCVQLNLISYLCIWKYKRRQGFVVFVNVNWLCKCVWQLLPPKLCWNFRFCLYHMHFNRLWISGMTESRSQTANWNTLISCHLKHTNLHFEWGYLQQNRYYLTVFSSTSHGSVTYPLIANGLPKKHAGSSAPEVIQQATGRWMQYIWLLVSWH